MGGKGRDPGKADVVHVANDEREGRSGEREGGRERGKGSQLMFISQMTSEREGRVRGRGGAREKEGERPGKS
jgi:hypothetical protein